MRRRPQDAPKARGPVTPPRAGWPVRGWTWKSPAPEPAVPSGPWQPRCSDGTVPLSLRTPGFGFPCRPPQTLPGPGRRLETPVTMFR